MLQTTVDSEAYSKLGSALWTKGRVDEAIAAYRQSIALKPNYLALSNLGVALSGKGQLDDAIAAFRQAIALKPTYAALSNLGVALAGKGQLDDAIAAFRQAIALQPNYARAHNNLGNALRDTGQLDEAVVVFRHAIALEPNYPEALSNLGNALRDQGQLDEAIAAYRRAIALKPNYPEVHRNLGIALKDQGQLDEAIAAFRQAIALKPDCPDTHNNLGNALKDKGRLDEAIVAFRQAIALKPDYSEAYNNLGNVLAAKGQLDDSIAAYRKAITLKPDFPEAHYNLGAGLTGKGQLDEAMAAYPNAIALKPGYAEAHKNLAFVLLGRGNFSQGWEEYEWRWECRDFSSPQRNFPQPLWDGRPLPGATLLLHAEQGFGDTIQFIRYLPLVGKRGKVIVECQPELQRLIQATAPDTPVIASGQPLPAFDTHCPLLSLPRVLATTLDNLPRQVPYLQPDFATAQRWRERVQGHSAGLKVGLVWAGSKLHTKDADRSIALSAFAALGRLQAVDFYSLQKGEASAETKDPPPELKLIDWTHELADFADTAGLIANLDLVIAVDTAVAHLAGAMSKPVWVLLPFSADWRWLLEREDSPWYPTMRLFRQASAGDWDGVVERVAEALRSFSVAKCHRQIST